MRTAFSVSKSVPAKVAAIVIPIAASGPIPSGVGLNRAQLAALGFEGKTSQTHTLTPAAGKTAVRVLVGIGDVRDLNTSVLRNVAASAARACARYESIATTLPSPTLPTQYWLQPPGAQPKSTTILCCLKILNFSSISIILKVARDLQPSFLARSTN